MRSVREDWPEGRKQTRASLVVSITYVELECYWRRSQLLRRSSMGGAAVDPQASMCPV